MTCEKIFSDIRLIIQNTVKEIQGDRLVYDYLIKESPINIPPLALIATGKASISMAKGAARALKELGHRPSKSLVITKYRHDDGSLQLPNLQIIESAHPLPDQQSLKAGQALIDLCQWTQQTANQNHADWILCLISGGSSSLVEHLKSGVSLEELQRVNKHLLSSGKDIETMNKRRKEMSLLKHGGLAQQLPVIPIVALYLSDVPTNDPAIIGSGLLAGKHSNIGHEILADNAYARNKALAVAEQLGYEVVCHPELVDGEVETIAAEMFKTMTTTRGKLHIWGGEPVVNLPADAGLGGRNQHLCLLMANYMKQKLSQDSNCLFASVGTDGSDGFTDYAGAMIDNNKAWQIDDIDKAISKANSTPALEKVDATLNMGASGSNLMDIMLGYINN